MSPGRFRQLPLLAACAVFMLPAFAMAGGSAPSAGCPAGTVCDRALGVALVPPSGWRQVPPGHWPPHTLVWYVEPSLGLDYNTRLLLGPNRTTHDSNDAHAAEVAANKLVAGYRGHVHMTRYAVRYGSAPGVLIRGLPGGPGPDAFIILAHQGALYSIIAPGATLAPDQRQALASLRFIPRVGPFPSANPPVPFVTRGPGDYRKTGGDFAKGALTLSPSNGLRHGSFMYSRWFHASKVWSLSYDVACSGPRGRLVVRIEDIQGRVRDLLLHRAGVAHNIRQAEEISGLLRLDMRSDCPRWSVTAAGITD